MYCLSHLCYCCLKKRKNLTNIQSLDSDNISFEDKIIFCQLNTHISDEIPKYLCQKCCKGLHCMYQFRKNFCKRQKILQGYVTKLKSSDNNYTNIYSTISIDLLDVHQFIPTYNTNNTNNNTNHNTNNTNNNTKIDSEPSNTNNEPSDISILKHELVPDDKSLITKKLFEVDVHAVDFTINQPFCKQDAVVQQENEQENNYEIVDNEFNVVHGDNNVLKIVRKKDDLKITFKKSNLNDGQLSCIFCDKSFVNKQLLRQHERTHNNNKSYKCKICARVMYNKYTYRIHFGKHNGEYKFRCPTCNKGLSSKQYLLKHKQIHCNHQKIKTKQHLLTTADKDWLTPTNGETADVTLENSQKPFREIIQTDENKLENKLENKIENKAINKKRGRPKVCMSPLRINIKRNQIISNKKRGRPKKSVQGFKFLPFQCAICDRTFNKSENLFLHLKIVHNIA